MKTLFKTLAATSALALAPAVANAQQSTPDPVPDTVVSMAEAEAAAPAFWRVADEDTTIYLFGTVHALPEGNEWFAGPLKTAMNSADELVFEVRAEDQDPAVLGPYIQSIALLPEGQNLRTNLNEEQNAKLTSTLAQYNLPADTLNGMEPWFASIQLSSLPLLTAGISGEAGAEKVLDAQARQGVPHYSLETAEYQLSLFDNLPMEAQVKMLTEAMDGMDEVVPSLTEIMDAWRRGDVDKLDDLLNQMEDTPEMYELIFLQRNRNWAQWIDDRLDLPGTSFIAVGAGHLAGDGSVQKLLEQRGIASERLQ